ncbi:hypothetical protein KDH_53420 [Dictyobacter sp. S3.2.2.5]|uniref:Uncharacterized protein n=1 Tax=Dictyobacter halimunensis TaxID=3026934 RepID=A0ABQ6FW88_9CHLR|nr:hypothetical protein KDH_53420 [Dictyobacter sp. S3.2.2.5]
MHSPHAPSQGAGRLIMPPAYSLASPLAVASPPEPPALLKTCLYTSPVLEAGQVDNCAGRVKGWLLDMHYRVQGLYAG